MNHLVSSITNSEGLPIHFIRGIRRMTVFSRSEFNGGSVNLSSLTFMPEKRTSDQKETQEW